MGPTSVNYPAKAPTDPDACGTAADGATNLSSMTDVTGTLLRHDDFWYEELRVSKMRLSIDFVIRIFREGRIGGPSAGRGGRDGGWGKAVRLEIPKRNKLDLMSA